MLTDDRAKIAKEDKERIRKGFISDIVASDIYDLLNFCVYHEPKIFSRTVFDCVALKNIKNIEVEHNEVRIRTWRKNLKITVEEEEEC